jgi:enoyl-[acyl-carrier-protein] reductase (NADH)
MTRCTPPSVRTSNRRREDVLAELARYQPQGVPFIAPSAITDAVMFLVSDGARHITGETISVAAGQIPAGAAWNRTQSKVGCYL